MARPKTKSALVEGMTELVDSIRNIDSKLNMLLKNKNLFGPKRGPGRPAGTSTPAKKKSGSKRGPGRPPSKTKRGPGRPASKIKRGPGRPPAANKKSAAVGRRKRGRGRPPGSKNK